MPSLPKEYKAAVFEAKGQPLTFKQVKLELPKPGEVRKKNITSMSLVVLTDIIHSKGLGQGTGLWCLPFRRCRPECLVWQFLSHSPW